MSQAGSSTMKPQLNALKRAVLRFEQVTGGPSPELARLLQRVMDFLDTIAAGGDPAADIGEFAGIVTLAVLQGVRERLGAMPPHPDLRAALVELDAVAGQARTGAMYGMLPRMEEAIEFATGRMKRVPTSRPPAARRDLNEYGLPHSQPAPAPQEVTGVLSVATPGCPAGRGRVGVATTISGTWLWTSPWRRPAIVTTTANQSNGRPAPPCWRPSPGDNGGGGP